MKDNKHKILLSMGYRKVEDNYFKPVGYSLYCYHINKKVFAHIFISRQKEEYLYNTANYNPNDWNNDFLLFIKEAEYNTGKVYSESDFEFLTKEQEFEGML